MQNKNLDNILYVSLLYTKRDFKEIEQQILFLSRLGVLKK